MHRVLRCIDANAGNAVEAAARPHPRVDADVFCGVVIGNGVHIKME